MPQHIDTSFTRYACNCVVTPEGWRPRDTEPNGNTRDLDPVALRASLNRAGGPRDTDESPRVVESLRAAKARGIRAADFDKMAIAKVAQKDEQGKDIMAWSAPPGRCPQHDAPVVIAATYDYVAPDVMLDEFGDNRRGSVVLH